MPEQKRPTPESVQAVSVAMMALRQSAEETSRLAAEAIASVNAAVPDMTALGMLVMEPGPMKATLWKIAATYDTVLSAHDLGSKLLAKHNVALPVIQTRGPGGGR